ncbi:PAS domain-containing sensor histidine kinase [Hymenobacter lucidus]|uniref:histidine kinase n=1 Tax=Hymenobacter lucidus TaxID=2880930 RepID=A0ABS8AJZ4_9BACT|nr:PAS domain-containing protein [Hymenobacter lucidus]MCB2406527.1 PAS domain-containing protein [Hymenobacter lucidus]
MSTPLGAVLPADVAPSEELLQVLLTISLSGVILFRPVFSAPEADIIDLAYVRLNPAAQQMLELPAQPAESFLTLYPAALTMGIFDFYKAAFLSGEVARQQFNYQHDGLDGYFYLVAQRHGPLLVVSFTDTNDQSRTAVEEALRVSQAREQQARAEAELQRAQLHNVLLQAPAMICIFDGPEHRFQFVNGPYQALVGERPLLGKPIAEAMPELRGQPIFELLDSVYRTGETFYATEMLVQLDHDNASPAELEKRYYNFIYQARRDLRGAIDGILVFAYEVTPQVQARRAVEESARQLAALNTALDHTNAELAALNQDLEARVAQRTHEAQTALLEAEHQREQLRVQQGLLRQILGQVPASIATLAGPEHHFSFFNDQYLALTTGRAQLGLTAAEVLPEVVEQGFIELLDQVYATGVPFVGADTPVLLHDDHAGQTKQHFLDFVYQPLFDENRQIQGILAFIVDVTEKVQARRQVEQLQAHLLATAQHRAQEREDLYQVFEQAPTAIILLREPAHRIEYFNPAYDQLFPGRSRRGHTLAETQPEAVDQGLIALLDEVYQTGKTHTSPEIPFELTWPDGRPRPVYFNFTYQAYREDDRIVGVSIFAFDVTGQVMARQHSEATAGQLRLLTDALPVLIGYLDRERRYRFANRAYESWFGQVPEKLLGRPVREVVGEKAYAAAQGYMDRALAGEQLEFTARMPYREGFVKHIHTNYIPDVQHGQVLGFYTLVTDITDQVVASERVQALNEELAAINEEMQATNEELSDTNNRLSRTNADLDTFVYTASHDLKAPISNIEGLLTALREQLPAEALRTTMVPHILNLMRDSVARFQQTIGHLTNITQLQHSDATGPEIVDVAALVEDVRLDLDPLLAAAQARLTVVVEPGLWVQFAPKNLRSIVYNLLSNAVKYCAADRLPIVELRCYRTDTRVVLTVQDNGLGLSLDQQGKLFRLFRRLHTHVEGSGVGLYTVKRLVENAGGTITVHSQPDEGATFTVSLPG